MNQNDLDWFAARLSIAVYDTNREYQMGMEDLRSRLGTKANALSMQYGDGGKTEIYVMGDIKVTLPAGSSQDDVIAALQNPFMGRSMSISGYEPGAIRAKLDALKKDGKVRRDAALAKLEDAGSKHEAVSAEIEKVASQIEKEADAALQEFAEFSNGAPA